MDALLTKQQNKLLDLPDNNKVREYWLDAVEGFKKMYGIDEIPTIHLLYNSIDDEEMKGFIGLLVAKTNTHEVFPWLDLEMVRVKYLRRTSIKGILIEDVEFFDERYSHNGCILYDIDLKKHVELDTSRSSIISNKEWLKISRKLIEYICQLIEDKLSKRNKITSDRYYYANNQMLYYIMHSKGNTMEIPRVKQLYKRYLVYRCVNKGRIEYLSADQVASRRDIIGVNSRRYLDPKDVDEIIQDSHLFKKDKSYIIDYYNDINWEFIPSLKRIGLRGLIPKKEFDKLFLKNIIDNEQGPMKEDIYKRLNV
jgi:hypothetical protein